MRRYGPAIIAAIASVVLLVDQVTKYLARTYLASTGESVRVIGDLVRLTFTRNEGAAFGMLPGNVVLFIPVHVLVLIVITAYVWRRRPESAWVVAALGLVAGGAMGNLIDRVIFGWVTDFIQIPFDFPIFNAADSAVVVGVGILVWWLLFGPGSHEHEPVTECADVAVETGPESGPATPEDAVV